MPVNKNAFTRIIILDRLLSDRYHAYSIQNITDIVSNELTEYGIDDGVSRRCIEKDIEYLEFRCPFMVELERYYIDSFTAASNLSYRKKCIRYADPTFSIFTPKLSDNEKYALSSIFDTVSLFTGLHQMRWLKDLKEKIGNKDNEPVIHLSENPIDCKHILTTAFTAIRSMAVLTVDYCKFGTDAHSLFQLSPYMIREYGLRWYLIGFRHDNRKICTLAIDRICNIRIVSDHEFLRPCVNLNDRFEEIIGISYNDSYPLERIIFWADENTKHYIESKPLHISQKHYSADSSQVNALPTGGAFFQIECRYNYELIRTLCSYGAGLKVISPKPVIDAIKQRIHKMAQIYNLRT